MDLLGLLQKLDRKERSLIYMKYYLGYTLEEIAIIMQMPAGTVKSRIYGNLKALKKELEPEEA